MSSPRLSRSHRTRSMRTSRSLSPNTKLHGSNPKILRLEDELRNIELAQRKEAEQWLIQHYKPSKEEIDRRLRDVDMKEENGIEVDQYYTGYGDEIGETTWHRKENLKKLIAEERAKRPKNIGGRKSRRNGKRRR
jgi:hypothetical protein